MVRRAAGNRTRERSPDKSPLLPALRNPARCRASGSNQHGADAEERRDADAQWDGRHRRLQRRKRRDLEHRLEPLPQLAFVYLPPVLLYCEPRRPRERTTKPFASRRRCYSSGDSSEEEGSRGSDEDGGGRPKVSTMRSQRMQSFAAMAKLQHDAALTIQREFRFYRRRQVNRNRRNQRLARQAQDFLDVFLAQELTNVVPVCLLDVLRETCLQEAATTKRREDFAASLAKSVLVSFIDECIRDVFRGVLQAMVKSYLTQRIDLSRAATSQAHAVAGDVLNDWVKELVMDLLPEVLVELTSEYTAQQQHDELWDALIHDELQSVAVDAVTSDDRT